MLSFDTEYLVIPFPAREHKG